MTKQIFHSISLLLLVTLLLSCSTRKDRFLNRSLHTTKAKYNVIYNGQLAYDSAKKQLDDGYVDDFSKILPIEPLKIEDKIEGLSFGENSQAKGAVNKTVGFVRAEEKAVKTVQKHSMNFSGLEKNKQIAKAYLLLGKARYYDQRFVPALETFFYMIKHFPKSPLFNEAKIWEAKCLNRLGNEDDAIENLKKTLKDNTLSDQIKTDAYTTIAMAYTSFDSIKKVIKALESSLQYKTNKHHQKARNLFILGQLYRQENQIDSSNSVFSKLMNFKKAHYHFKIHAELEIAKNYDKNTDNTEHVIANLKKLSRNRDNRPFLDEIHYHLGKINLENGKIDNAICRFNKSLTTKIKHNSLQSLSYEELGNINFDKTKFVNAGAYYDSILHITQNKNTKRIKNIIRKRKSIDEIIRLEKITMKNDSILSLIAMNDEGRSSFFKKYIEELKDKKASEINTREEESLQSNKTEKGRGFYFYNKQIVDFGQIEFKRIWGERDLVDNWRLSFKKIKIKEKDNFADSKLEDKKESKYNLNYYLDKIPTDSTSISMVARQRNDAYYKLGVIYKEKFHKDEIAIKKLEKLLQFSPEEKLLLPTYYHLYKAFEKINVEKSDFYKTKILEEYPESKYAQIINDPTFIAVEDDNIMEESYVSTYEKYTSEEYDAVIIACEKYIISYVNTTIIAKFELLKAYAIAKKSKNKNIFIKELTSVVTNYPKTEEAIHAENVIASLTGKIKTKKIKNNTKKTAKKIGAKKRKEARIKLDNENGSMLRPSSLGSPLNTNKMLEKKKG